MTVTTPVLRLRVLTSSRDEFPGEAERVCLDEGLAAVGWAIDRTPNSWDAYYARAVEYYSLRDANTVRRLVQAPSGTMVWLRDREGSYHLGELHGEWLYDESPRAVRLDIANTRPCRWSFVGGAMDVPGVVVRAFTGPGPAVRTIEHPGARRYSAALLQGVSPGEGYTSPEIIRELLDDTDVEDLVALYLQATQGVFVVPPDRQRGHPGYDLEFVHPSGRRGVVQVKSGEAAYDFASLTDQAGEKWAFVASEQVFGEGRTISLQELADFLDRSRGWLPQKLARWTVA